MPREVDLAYWINERELIRGRKDAALTPPWSTDPHMANVRYCNIRREDDRVTRWVMKNWRNPNRDSPLLTLGMVTARMINWPPSLDIIGFPTAGVSFDRWAGEAKGLIRNLQREDEKAWTSAYTISTCGRAMKKEDYVFDHVLAQVSRQGWAYTKRDDEPIDLADAFSNLTRIDGLGSFLAAQVVADLKNTPGHPLAESSDWWSWSAPGPGSLRGLQAFYGGQWRGRSITASVYPHAIRECADLTFPLLARYVGQLHMQDFQNCLCEFSKFIRMKEGDGRARNSYTPGRRADYNV